LIGTVARVRILIVKLSSLGDVVHTMPAVQDIRAAHPGAQIDWVVEPGFAPLVRRVDGVGSVIECSIRRWRQAWWTARVRAEWRAFRERLRAQQYDKVIDLQGLTKSALISRLARGKSYGLGNQTEGASYEWPARWLVDHTVKVQPHIHAVDRARTLAAFAMNMPIAGPPSYGLRAKGPVARPDRPTVVFVHGTSREDKLWPHEYWIKLGKHILNMGWRIALPQGNEAEQTRAELIAAAWQFERGTQIEVWPTLGLDAVVDRLAATQGVIGVDSGLSHVAVALNLPHVQLYNFPTSWRTGPLVAHGHKHQVVVEARPVPTVEAVWSAWKGVLEAPRA
jgi:heptosyltransferase I